MPKRDSKENYNQTTAKLSAEELAIREENLNCRKNYSARSVHALYAAVALRAVQDFEYRLAYGDTYVSSYCEEFFDSDAFGCLCNGLGSKDVRELLERRMKEKDGWVYFRRPVRVCPV